jgi:trk system potassium uptake protein TrkA
MKIIILGSGRVGTSVAETLSSEQNDITVVDTNAQTLAQLQDRFDLRGVVGNATHLDTLRDAGAEDADLLIACATQDETNLVACKIAKAVFNVPTRIARVRSTAFQDHPELMGEDGFCVDHLICPEQSITDYILKLVEFPEALQVLEFAHGKVSLVAVRAYAGGPLVSHPIQDLRKHLPNVEVRIVAIFRDNRLVIPDGRTMIEPGDEVFCLAASKHIRQTMSELRRMDKPVKRILIAGGGNIGLRVADALDGRLNVKMIELDKRRCEFLAGHLSSRALVLNGDTTDEDLLEDEGVADLDLFIALTSDDENNIMSSLLAKRMGARRVIALINRRSYAELMEGGRIDIAISPAQTTIGELLKHVRRGDIVAVHSLRRGAAEALEIIAHGDPSSSKVVGKRIEQLALPKGVSIGALVRGDTVIVAHHDTVIQSEDHLIVFVPNKRMIRKVEKLFQVGVHFF